MAEGTQCSMGSASGRCLIGADKAGPQEDSQRLQQFVMTQCHLSEAQAAVRWWEGWTEHRLGIRTGFESQLQILPQPDPGQDGPPAVPQVLRL